MEKYKPVFKYCKPQYNIENQKHHSNKINNIYYLLYHKRPLNLEEEIVHFLVIIFYGLDKTDRTGFDAFTYFEKQNLDIVLIDKIILNISRERSAIPSNQYEKNKNEVINLLKDYRAYIILKSANVDNSISDNMITPDKYFNDYFNQIDNKANLSIYNFYNAINHAAQNFKKEIIANLEKKDSDTSKLFYIERIKIKFSELVPDINDIPGYPLKYKQSCNQWCKMYNCENSLQLFQTYSSGLSPLFETVPVELENLSDFPKARNIYFDFLYFIRFSSLKEVYEYLIKQERIINPLPVKTTPMIVGSTYYTEKTLLFIKNRFEEQIVRGIFSQYYYINSSYDLLDFDILRNELRTYYSTKELKTFNLIHKLAKENEVLFTSKIQYLSGKNIEFYRIIENDVWFVNNSDQSIIDFNCEKPKFSRCFTNNDFVFYCSYIIEYIDEIYANENQRTTVVSNNNFSSNIIKNTPFMENKDYAIMLIDGFKNDPKYFAGNIKSIAVRANDNYIVPEVFFSHCYDIIESFNILFVLKNGSDNISKDPIDIRGITKREFESFLKYNDSLKIKNAIDEALNMYKKDNPSFGFNKNNLTGIDRNLNNDQITNLFNQIKNVYIDSTFDDFSSFLNKDILPHNFVKIKWILLNRDGGPHKTALREFLTLLLGKCPSQKIIDTFITDKKGLTIKLAKPKAGEYSNYYNDFTDVFSKSSIFL